MLHLNVTFQQLGTTRRMPEGKAKGGNCICLNHTGTHPEELLYVQVMQLKNSSTRVLTLYHGYLGRF